MRISDWSSDVCSSDLCGQTGGEFVQEWFAVPIGSERGGKIRTIRGTHHGRPGTPQLLGIAVLAVGFPIRIGRLHHGNMVQGQTREEAIFERLLDLFDRTAGRGRRPMQQFFRSEEHTSELQSLMRSSYAFF